jgi:tripartite-type tricarboxylate transporter receptor subunit TctC
MTLRHLPSRRHCLVAGLAGLAAAAAPQAWAQRKYPQQPVRLVVPFAAAGAIDNMTRVVAQAMARELGQPVLVDNRAGAGGNIGGALVAKAPADGYTLLVGTSATHGANPTLFAKPGYDAARDFEPIMLFGSVPNVLVVQNENGAKSVAELVARAKAAPGKLSYASAGNGTSLHLAGVMFERAAGVQLTHVAYKGGGPASIDLMGGVVDMMFDTVAVALPLLQSGKERALAVAASERHFALPDVPTFAELGFKGVEAATWAGLFAPKGTPPDVLAELRRASEAALSDAAVRTALRGMGVQVSPRSGDAFGAFVQSEIQRWGQVVRSAGIAPS